MSEIALARINSFAPMAQQGQVSPSEQLQTTFQDALECPQSLLEIVQDQAREIKALNAKIEALQKDMDSLGENQLIQLRLIADLRKVQEPQPLQKDRGEKTLARIAKLKEGLRSRGQGMTLKEVGRLLDLKPNQVTALVIQLDKRAFEIFTRAGDARQKVIRLRSFT
jgi:predicted RNase H-like nuclease (RuvC/YqgF family)